MIRILAVLVSVLINSCGNTQLVTIDENKIDTEMQTPSGKVTKDVVTNATSSLRIHASDYGAKGDAIQLADFRAEGDIVLSESANFNNADVGKIISIAYAGQNDEHLVTSIKRVLDSKRVQVRDKASKNVTNSLGSYGTDNIVYLQNAIDASIAKNRTLYVEEGIYLIGDINEKTKKTALSIEMTLPGQSFKMKGAGKKKTIFREIDGKTQRIGRYTKIFYHYLNNPNDINLIELSDFSLDKNGRSLTKNPPSLYTWEQAHCWSWAGSKNAPNKIEGIIIKNLEIIDKIGAGINFSSFETRVGSVYIDNITQTGFLGNSHLKTKYGQRGDLEISCFSNAILMENLDLGYMQIEPVNRFTATKDKQRHATIRNSIINTLEYTEGDNGDAFYSSLTADNITSTNFVVRSLKFKISNSTLSVKRLINSVDGNFYNCKFLLPYDKQVNEIKPINNSYLSTLGKIKNKIIYDKCSFMIDNTNINLLPKGYAMTASSKVDQLGLNTIVVKNSLFDKRLEGTANTYGNGTWSFFNCELSGREDLFITGGYSRYIGQLFLSNNKLALKTSAGIRIQNNNDLWSINLGDEDPDIANRLKFKRPGKYNRDQIIN